MKRVLLIGGTDSSGGAGLARDIAVTNDYRHLAKPVVTCITAQTNTAVRLIHEVPAAVITAQINAAFADTPPDAIKVGMVGTGAAGDAITDALTSRNVPIVLDPVLKSSSGRTLSDAGSLQGLIAIATLLTPNLEEAARLSNRTFANCDAELSVQAEALRKKGAKAVLIKGGHGCGDICCDHLFDTLGRHRFCLPRLTLHKRGTGCSLATAVACELASDRPLRDACRRAKNYMQNWIASHDRNV